MEESQDRLKKTKESLIQFRDRSIEEYNKLLPYFKKYGFILLILIPLILNFYLRLQTAYIPASDNWAADQIINNLRQNVRQEINQQYPNLPEANKQDLINKRVDEIISANYDEFQRTVGTFSEQLKSQLRDQNEYTYLLELDPYFWARGARNILDHGYPGDRLDEEGNQIDDHMLAPIGREVPKDMGHAYVDAYLFKAASFFNKDISLERVAFFTPAIIIGLAVIVAFFLGKLLSGNIAGFFAATMVAIHNSILIRTMSGFADTDAYQIFFPLLIVLFFFLAMDSESKFKRVACSLFTGFLIGFYSFFWGGWWYIGIYIVAGSLIYLGYLFIISLQKKQLNGIFKKTEFSKTLLAFALIIISTAVFLTLFSGFREVWIIPFKALAFVEIHEISAAEVWPNVFITVAEQNEGTISYAIDSMGGPIFYFFALAGILLYPFIRRRNGIDIKHSVIILLWILTTTWAVTRGVRFSLMLAPIFAVAFGITISFVPLAIKQLFSIVNLRGGQYNTSAYAGTIFMGLLMLGLIPPGSGMWEQSKGIAFGSIPMMNDAWWDTLESIKMNSSEDAIITSWWDYGHWFKYIADRPVTFDGTSQNEPQAHWVGKILITDNEREAIGILRMLDCGGRTGFEKLNERVSDIARTKDYIDGLTIRNKKDAKEYLIQLKEEYPTLSDNNIDEILQLTHCNPPEAFFIASDDMVSKSGVWGHFGLWDFNRSLMYNELTKPTYNTNSGVEFLQDRFDLTKEEAEDTYFQIIRFDSKSADSWISPWPGYISIGGSCNRVENSTLIVCPKDNIQINKTEEGYKVKVGENSLPSRFVYYFGNETGEEFYTDDSSYSITAYGEDGIKYLVSSKAMANSIFTRMFFLNGKNLNYFDMFSYIRSFNGMDIYVYKVNWDKLLEEDN